MKAENVSEWIKIDMSQPDNNCIAQRQGSSLELTKLVVKLRELSLFWIYYNDIILPGTRMHVQYENPTHVIHFNSTIVFLCGFLFFRTIEKNVKSTRSKRNRPDLFEKENKFGLFLLNCTYSIGGILFPIAWRCNYGIFHFPVRETRKKNYRAPHFFNFCVYIVQVSFTFIFLFAPLSFVLSFLSSLL